MEKLIRKWKNISLQRLFEMMEDQAKRMDECLKMQKEMKVTDSLWFAMKVFLCTVGRTGFLSEAIRINKNT